MVINDKISKFLEKYCNWFRMLVTCKLICLQTEALKFQPYKDNISKRDNYRDSY